ncbi:c(7)-type cytochrome triheme domain-containing protein [Nitrospirota bacterium]
MKKNMTPLLIAFIVMAFGISALYASERVFHGGEIVYSYPVKGVLFSHKFHVEDMGFGCDACHPIPFNIISDSAQGKEDFTMKGLIEGKYCGVCHAPDGMAFASDTQCARCHVGSKGYRRALGTQKQSSH